jgi:hypothetical protein
MFRLLTLLLGLVARFFRARRDLLLENTALRQQLTILKQKHPHPRIAVSDKLVWAILRRRWAGWKQALIVVRPETVVRWHRAGFKLYWKRLSRHRSRPGRRCVGKELHNLIFRPRTGPRVHRELMAS